jgi:hypothetical protein
MQLTNMIEKRTNSLLLELANTLDQAGQFDLAAQVRAIPLTKFGSQEFNEAVLGTFMWGGSGSVFDADLGLSVAGLSDTEKSQKRNALVGALHRLSQHLIESGQSNERVRSANAVLDQWKQLKIFE